MTSVAIGPAVSPAEAARAALDRGRDGDLGIVGRREADEPAWLRPVSTWISAVPVLPANVAPGDRQAAGRSLLGDVGHHLRNLGGRLLAHHGRWTSGSSSSVVRPSGSVTSCTNVGSISCAAVGDRRGDLRHLHRRDEHGPPRLPGRSRRGRCRSPRGRAPRPGVDGAAGGQLVGREVDRRGPVEAEALHVLDHRLGAELLADLGPVGVDRVGQRRRHVDRPEVLLRRRSRAGRRRSRSRSRR